MGVLVYTYAANNACVIMALCRGCEMTGMSNNTAVTVYREHDESREEQTDATSSQSSSLGSVLKLAASGQMRRNV